MLTADRLRSLIEYRAHTGKFIWRERVPVDRWAIGWNTRWAGKTAGTVDAHGYLVIKIENRFYKAHRLAWLYMTGAFPSLDIDHCNLNKKDNRWQNLRSAARAQNGANRPKNSNNTSGFKGVFWVKNRQRWMAKIVVAGRKLSGQHHTTKSSARAEYIALAKKHFGEFARP